MSGVLSYLVFFACVMLIALAAQGATVQVILIGLALVAVLLLRPRGLIGEEAVVSRHAGESG